MKAIAFTPAPVTLLNAPNLERWTLPEAAGHRIVFVNGVFAPEWSDLEGLPAGVTVRPIAQGTNAQDALVEAHLGRHARFDSSVFAALNTAFVGAGAVVAIARHTTCKAPIHLLFVTVGGTEARALYPRVLVVAEPLSSATIVQQYVSLNDGVCFTDAVTEVAVAEDARLQHVTLQDESRSSYHIAHTAVSLGRNAVYGSQAITLGAALSRHDLAVRQDGEGIDCTLQGLAFLADQQLADTHSTLDHATPHGTSRQLHKTILGDRSRAVFNGKILVRQGSQQTDSQQSSRNLLLSEGARVDAKPQLEIFADDVKCAHGATVGQLEPDEVFYLQSRGLSESAARSLLTYAFAAEVIDAIPVPTLRDRLKEEIMGRLV